jgi:hypothetical protein
MKTTTTILGITGASLTALGTIFKFLHWPGASIMITVGATALVIYMLFYIFVQGKVVNGVIEKSFITLMGLTGILMALGFMFKMQHWPGSGVLITIFVVLSILLIILSLIRALNEKAEDLRYKYTQTFIWLLGGGIIILYPIIQMLNS